MLLGKTLTLCLLLSLLLAPLPVWCQPANPKIQARITIEAGAPQKAVNRRILGQNVLVAGNGMWDARTDTLETEAACLIQKIHPTVLRFPGGSLSNRYIWEDGLGTIATSPVTPGSLTIHLADIPFWTGVRTLRLIDRHGGKYGDLGSFLFQKGNTLLGVKGFGRSHPAGASLRPELRPGQVSWHSNSYGIVEHLKLCEKLGAEALITVNYGSGLTREGTVSTHASLSQRLKRAMAWVAYLNGRVDDSRPLGKDEEDNDWQTVGYWAKKRLMHGRPQPFSVQLWEIGNEIYDRHEVGFTSAQRYGEDFVRFARAMKWVDPAIKIGAVGLTDPNAKGDADGDSPWDATVLDLTREDLDFLVVHPYYPSAGAHPVSYNSQTWFTAVMGGASQALAHLKELRAVIDTSGGRGPEIKLIVSEYGIWPVDSKSGEDYANLARALYDADLLLGLLKHNQELGLDLAAAWNLHGNNPTAALKFDFSSESRVVRPHYLVYELLQTHLGKTILPVQAESPVFHVPRVGNVGPLHNIPSLQVMASLNSRGRLILWVLNRSVDRAITTHLTLPRYYPGTNAQVRTLNGPSLAAHHETAPGQVKIQTAELEIVGPTLIYTFPAHSLTIITF